MSIKESADVRDRPHPEAVATELSSRRTGMSFQRTRMSADRTLMSVLRTALSLITFGFTIFHAFRKLGELQGTHAGDLPARNFALALVLLGIGLVAFGIAYHIAFMLGLRRGRMRLRELGIVHAESMFPVSLALIVALSLLAIGVLAFASIAYRLGPFQ